MAATVSRAQDRWPWNPSADPPVRMREDLQQLAFALLERKARKNPCGMVFTSPARGAGTSTILVGVARELQRNPGVRCVIVELNRLRPCLGSHFFLDSSRSVVKMISNELTLRDCAQKESGGLSIVPAGGEWAGSAAATITCRALQQAESEFDMVLFDAPSGAESTDAMAIGSVAKDMIVVAAAGRANRDSLEQLRSLAAMNNVNIVGSVLTMRDRVAPSWLFSRRGR